MEIVVEYVLGINFILNSFIIKSTSLFFKEKARLWWLSAFIGAVVALILPLFNLNGWLRILFELLLAVLLVSISFSFKTIKRFLALYGVFLGITFLFGGACYAVEVAIGQLPLFCILLTAGLVQIVITAIFKYRNKARLVENFTFKVRLQTNGKEIEEEGFLDSGNLLCDPITKKPIILITFDVFSRLYQNINYLSAFTKSFDLTKIKNAHYIRVNSVASGTSILVFTVEKMELFRDGESEVYKNVLIGLSFSGFERTLGRKILLNSAYA